MPNQCEYPFLPSKCCVLQECTAACAILSKVAADSRAALSDLARSLIDQHSTGNGCDLADIPQARIDTLYTAGSALKSSLTRLPSPPTLPEASGSATTDNVLNIAAAVPSSSLTFSTGISLDCAIGHLLYCTALTRSQLAQASLVLRLVDVSIYIYIYIFDLTMTCIPQMVPDSGDELDSTQLSFLLSALAEVVSFPVVTDEDLSIFRSTQLLSPSFGKKIVAIISTCESRQCDDALTELKGVSSELKAIAPQALSRDTGVSCDVRSFG